MGLAVFHGHHLDGGFTLPFYKMLLNKAIVLDDITHVDPELHRSLTWMLYVISFFQKLIPFH
jgi:E3 ubiquitin ligase SMURF1/2